MPRVDRTRRVAGAGASPQRTDRLTWWALGLALAMVLARGMMSDSLRPPFETNVQPGSVAEPRAPGAAAALGLDVLCCVPALLVLLRGMMDRTFTLRHPRSFIPLGLLCAWMLMSTFWASDKFAAIVTAAHWTAAMALLWAGAQLVRNWVRLRLAAAVLFSLLAVYALQALNYRFLEAPAMRDLFLKDRDKMLTERGYLPGSFIARQFEEKLKRMEVFGFFQSPNTLGAAASLLMLIGAGLMIQRIVEGDAVKWAVPAIAIVLIGGVVVLALSRSRGAFATVGLGLVGFALLGRYREALGRKPRRAFAVGLIVVIGGLLAVIAHGVAHGRLPTSTLTFRWQYWVGAARMIRQRPLLGTGWSNFYLDYLAQRLPNAPEEIKDPHDFLVRFFSELGVVGGMLVIVWGIGLWWELCACATRERAGSLHHNGPGVVKFVAAVAGGATALCLIFAIDWAREPLETFLPLRLLFFGVMVLAGSLAVLRTLVSQEPDDRRAPWVLLGLLIGAGGMFIHNLIDFSMFETGPMCSLAMVLGCGLGMRARETEPAKPARTAVAVALVAALVIWIGLIVLWGQVSMAQRKSDAADDALRAGQMARAERLLEEANDAVWDFNADYPLRATHLAPRERASELAAQAIAQNPKDGSAWRSDAAIELHKPHPDAQRVRRDYETALRLDPYNVQARLEYADVLADKLNDRAGAKRELARALHDNNSLNPDEKKRLPAEEVLRIEERIRLLGS
jgi:O-antigen ligase